MSYYFARILNTTFDDAVERATKALGSQGFGILSDIDVKQTLKQKIDVDFRNYRILGACNPHFAHQALAAEDKIGTMLPCNVVVQELAPGMVEVAAIDPISSMQAVKNASLDPIAREVQSRLRQVIEVL